MSNVEDIVNAIEECQDIGPLRVMALIQTAKLEAFKGAVLDTYRASLASVDPSELPTIERFMDSLGKNAQKAHTDVMREMLMGILGLDPDQT